MKTITQVDSTRPKESPNWWIEPKTMRTIEAMHPIAMRLICQFPVATIKMMSANEMLMNIPWIAFFMKISLR